MNKDSIIDYCGCMLFSLFSPVLRGLPVRVRLFLGRRLGDLLYYFDLKHKTLAYSNIKTAFADTLSPARLSHITRKFYRNFGQNLIDIFTVPSLNESYMKKYVKVEGLQHIKDGFKRGKGVILLGVHAGSWELSNIICANLGFRLSLLFRQQGYPRLNSLLNFHRRQKGCRLIQRKNQTRQLIEVLRNNEAIGMTADQGGKTGCLVEFFGKEASMSTGAVRLALQYDAALIPGFYVRVNGPYIKVVLEPSLKLKKTGDLEKDVRDNLQEVTRVFERYIRKYPEEYLWTYKIWKYARKKNILILSDAKAGHLRQAQAVADIINGCLKEKGIKTEVNTIEVKFKNKFSRGALILKSGLAGEYHCQGCLWCLKTFLLEDTYRALVSIKPDIIISSGSTLAPVNFVLSRENASKSITVMRPSVLSTNRFDLVVMPRHDNPPRRRNVAITEGAMNLIDEEYLKTQSNALMQDTGYKLQDKNCYIGLLIGGDAGDSLLTKGAVSEVINQIKYVSEERALDILVSSSRRTSKAVEGLLREQFGGFDRSKLLVIANEKNLPSAVGGILGLSRIVVISADSISMISEAASSGRYVIVFKTEADHRHKRFLDYMSKRGYIYLCEAKQVALIADRLWEENPKINTLEDRAIVKEALGRII